jgi:DNA-binding PadR family transcriptional regulator
MNSYDKAVLAVIGKGPDYVGWYKIEQRLSVMDLEKRESLPNSLKKLLEAGFIKEAPETPGKYKITDLGRSALGSLGE